MLYCDVARSELQRKASLEFKFRIIGLCPDCFNVSIWTRDAENRDETLLGHFKTVFLKLFFRRPKIAKNNDLRT